MSSERHPTGEYHRAPPNASRSPCPVVNALANHGFIERSGRKIYMEDLNASMRHVGMSPLLGSVFAKPTYLEYQNPAKAYLKKPVTFWQRLWGLLKNPYTFFDYFGCWKPGQVNDDGKRYINLVDLASHGAIEHDISLTRRDVLQPEGNNDPQQDLINELLSFSSDGKTLTVEDLSGFIRSRIQCQLQENPDLVYGPAEHQVNCGQVALMMGCFGNGETIRCDYVKAIFQEERLPWKEGWTKRTWWTMGLLEFFGAVKKMTAAVGIQF